MPVIQYCLLVVKHVTQIEKKALEKEMKGSGEW